MNKPEIVYLSIIIVLLIGGCSNNQAPTPTPSPSPTTIPTQPPTATPQPTPPVIDVPTGTVPTINGRIEPGEWESAAVETLNDGSFLYLMYAEDALYLAVDSDHLGTVNVGILRDKELWVLHSSAALGSMVYQPFEGGWQLIKSFEWCCRTTSPTSEYEQLVEKEGWLSTNQFTGNENQTEFMIRIPREELTVSVTYVFRDGNGAAFWPEVLPESDLLMFPTAPQVGDMAVFSDMYWGQLTISD